MVNEMKIETIPVFRPLVEQGEIKSAVASLERGWLGMGKDVGEFEKALEDYLELDERYVVAVSTGHAALHLGLLLMGVGPGDEVITPSFNNAADFQAILATGAKPVMCDIDDDTLCIDLAKMEELIGDKTKAIIAMDYDCNLCDHEGLQIIADKYNLRVLHDAAHSFGSRYKGKMVGSFSDVSMFSFDPVKTITCVDGGALVVKTKEEVERLHAMRLIGMSQPASIMYTNSRAWTYDLAEVGFRYHMANLHAAIGMEQLQKMDEISESRRNTCRFYSESLRGIKELRVPSTNFEDIVPFLYFIRLSEDKRTSFREYLSKMGVDTGIHWQPGHSFSLLKDCRKGDLSVTEKVGREIVSLPLHSKMDMEFQQRVVNVIRQFFS